MPPRDTRPRVQPQDNYYLPIAAMSLLQVPGSFASGPLWVGIGDLVVTLGFAVSIYLDNRGRFAPMFTKRTATTRR